MVVGGLYVDADRCAVFVFPTAWDEATGDERAWHVHGAFPADAPEAGQDWIASVRRCAKEDDRVTLSLASGHECKGRLTAEGVAWADGSAWQKVHVLGAQLLTFRRPPVPLYFTMLVFQLAQGALSMAQSLCRRVASPRRQRAD